MADAEEESALISRQCKNLNEVTKYGNAASFQQALHKVAILAASAELQAQSRSIITPTDF